MDQRQYLVHFVRHMLDGIAQSIEDLSVEDLHFRPHEHSNSMGFDAWHVFRTADNIVHFAFERAQPIWLQQGLDERWGLPRLAQGTGMEPQEAYALRFPDPAALAQYGRDVRDAILPRIEAMDDDYLQTVTRVVPYGDITRLEAIGQTLIAHGNNHLGRIDLARALLGKSGLGF